jgi:DNA-binding NarL/FixJ family response regulator
MCRQERSAREIDDASQRGDAVNINLIGREEEFGRLKSVLDGRCSGGGSLFLFEGGVGCGKSTLLDAILGKARSSRFAAVYLNGQGARTGAELDFVRQLTVTPGLPAQEQIRLAEQLRMSQAGTDHGELVHAVVSVLRQTAETRPLLVAVDDADRLDSASVDVLIATVHRTRTLRIVYVLTGSLLSTAQADGLGGRLLQIPWLQRLRLRPWDLPDVQRALERGGNMPELPAQVHGIHAVSGGNPLLVRAAAEEQADQRSDAQPFLTDPRPPFHPELGGPFSQALLTCLERSSDLERAAATAIAVLDHGTPHDVATLLDVSQTTVTQVVQALEATGIVKDGRFLHPVAAAAVLDTAPEAQRAELHRRAAVLFHGRNAEANVVARHLMASGVIEEDWQIAVLETAARQALERDDACRAGSVLRFALDRGGDEAFRARIRARLALISWRCNPTTAEEHLAAAVDAARTGVLGAVEGETLLGPVLLGGRVDDALEMSSRHAHPSLAHRTYGHASVIRAAFTRSSPDPGGTGGERPLLLGELGLLVTTPVWTFLGGQQGDAAERLLVSTPLTDGLIAPLVNAVKVLALVSRVDEADDWCRRLLREAESRDAPGWRAMLLTLQAELALIRGRLPLAERLAGEVAELIPHGGVFATGARAVQIVARTAMGRHSEAAHLLDQPVPEGVFDTMNGLGLLRARGRHYLATGSHREALDDFRALGLLARTWGIDRPALLPWRLDAAEAYLLLGEREHAQTLFEEQIADHSHTSARTQGIALRLRSELVKSAQRPRVLADAIEQLHRSGDRYELGRTYHCLATAFRNLGARPRATAMRHTARELAKECGAGYPTHEAQSDEVRVPRPTEAHAAGAPGRLSTSEHRVAVLAARGLTNREISRRLFITISTVEQHLTRVYRKLGVSRRQELVLALPESV